MTVSSSNSSTTTPLTMAETLGTGGLAPDNAIDQLETEECDAEVSAPPAMLMENTRKKKKTMDRRGPTALPKNRGTGFEGTL